VLPGGELLTKTEERDFDWDGARWKQLLYTSRYTRNKVASLYYLENIQQGQISSRAGCLCGLVLKF